MLRSKGLRPVSDKRRRMLAAHGITFLANTLVSIVRPDTDPPRWVRRLVAKRSGGRCEWPGCWAPAVDMHHRLNRKVGGRHGEMAELVNGPQWLLHACREHHERVTSASGRVLVEAKRWGWVLIEGQDAAEVRVMTRHAPIPVLLFGSGLLEVPDASA